MDNEKLKESELKESELEQKLVVNELNLDDEAGSQSVETSSALLEGEVADNQAAQSSTSSGKREPALIRVKNLKSRKEQKPSLPQAVRATRNRYIAIALTTTLVGVLIVPLAWGAWTLLKLAAPQSAGVQFFMKPPDGSQEKANQWRAKMRSMIAQVSNMPAPPLSKPATGYGDPRVGENVLTLLTAKKFSELNRIFANATKERVQHRTGSELIDDLYKALSDPGDVQAPAWEKRLSLLKEWAASGSDSVAAPHIVLADFYVQYAWKARGSGWANQVQESQWKLFRERLYLSADQLQQALEFGTPTPEWFAVAQVNVLGAGNRTDRPIYDSITRLSNSIYPNYVPTYLHTVYYLQPRWYGAGDEWATYATKEADKVGGDEGDKLYARMVNNVAHLYNNLYQEVRSLNKARVARGNALLDKQFGGGK